MLRIISSQIGPADQYDRIKTEWSYLIHKHFAIVFNNIVTEFAGKHRKIFFYLPYLSSIHEKAMYRYVLDGKFALAWELPFSGLPVFHMKVRRPVKYLPKDTTSELAGLFSTTSHKCQAPSREAIDAIF